MFGKRIAWQHRLILVLTLLTPETSIKHGIKFIAQSSNTALNEIAIPVHHLMIRPHPAHVFSFVRPQHSIVVLRCVAY